ncbi:glycosyltransferase family 4 protein [Candidatus Bipolaricaulota bacterium]
MSVLGGVKEVNGESAFIPTERGTGEVTEVEPIDQARAILFVVNVDSFFLSHRLPIALAARDHGYQVFVAAADTGMSSAIEKHGLVFRDVPFTRRWSSPLAELRAFRALVQACRDIRPDVMHLVTIKPIVLGWLASLFSGRPMRVNAITGLGFVFSAGLRPAIARSLVLPLMRMALRRGRSATIFQNPDDLELLTRRGIVSPKRSFLIRGSGVDCEVFQPRQSAGPNTIVLLASRMLRDKGVPAFVDMARIIHKTRPETRFVLTGDMDEGNPRSLRRNELEAWVKEGVVEWWGHQQDMQDVFAKTSIFVLPTTYREGVPLVLLEAAACGVPIVTTDAPGCREIVRNNVNGFLVSPGDDSALVEAVVRLLESPGMREDFGGAGRQIAVSEFSVELVVQQTMDVYRNLFGRRCPGSNKSGAE